MKILLAAGGAPQEWPEITGSEYDYHVGIDRGALYLLQQGFSLELAVGDFDSLNEEERTYVFSQAELVIQSPAEKDDTDTQLALVSTFERYPDADYTLVGATGGRLDHLLSILWLGLEPRFQKYFLHLTLTDRQNNLSYYLPGSYSIKKIPEMKYLAYCCLTPVSHLDIKESKYELENAT
ncbi:thiamine diphosphokinase, partial [Vibrio parahaemolyticus]|nr:thiamine diphosphokinase [Vibrio parahaemolyticus]